MGHKVKQSLVNSRADFFYHAFRNILLVSLPILAISAVLLASFRSSAMNSSADSVRINLPTSCTLSGNVTAEHAASMVSGQELRDIGTTEINTICNDKDGYIVYAKGTTQNSNGEVVLASNLGSNYDIKTGNIPSSDGDSSWAMKLSLGASTFPPTIVSDYDNKYVPVPNNWTKVVYRSASTATNSTATSIFTTTYGVYTTPGQPAGTYSGQVKYVMLHPSTTTVLPTTTLESAFAAAGKSKKSGILDPITGQTGSYYRMQDMENAICNAATLTDSDNSIQLVDDRDNKLYWVTKLTDGHCWMTQNLDLDLSPSRVLTSEDTDLNDNSLLGAYYTGYSYDAGSRVISWKPTNTTRDYQGGTGTWWSNNNNVAYSLDPGNWYWDGDDSTPNCNYLDSTKGCTHFTQNATGTNAHLSVGNYYNWSAAIASDGSSSLSSSTYNNITLNPQNSICPKGWRLPTISNVPYTTVNSTSEFGRLNQLYNGGGSTDPKLISAPLWFVRSGYVNNGGLGSPGSEARYWSSTVYSSVIAYYLYFTATSVIPASLNNYKDYGRSVRCVAR